MPAQAPPPFGCPGNAGKTGQERLRDLLSLSMTSAMSGGGGTENVMGVPVSGWSRDKVSAWSIWRAIVLSPYCAVLPP